MITLTITHEGRQYVAMTPTGLAEAGVPQEVIAAALAERRAEAVKRECKRRIYAVLSAETQMNMTAAAAAISSKPASSRSAEEKAVLAGLQAALGWVDAMRARAAELVTDTDADYLSDEAWPAPPAEVAQVAARF